MKLLLADAGLKCLDVEGIAWSPTRGLHLSDDVRLNYLVGGDPRLTALPFARADAHALRLTAINAYGRTRRRAVSL